MQQANGYKNVYFLITHSPKKISNLITNTPDQSKGYQYQILNNVKLISTYPSQTIENACA